MSSSPDDLGASSGTDEVAGTAGAGRAARRDAARADLARRRLALDAHELAGAGRRVAAALRPTLEALASARPSPGSAPPVVAGYAAVRGELPVDAALELARELGARTALPVTSGTAMRFVPFDRDTPMRAGRFGIAVPETSSDGAAPLGPRELDLVLVPLLGFDARLDRLGMGGGFYDRAFAHRRRAPSGPAVAPVPGSPVPADLEVAPDAPLARPALVGVAHAFQRLDDVLAMAWDVPLDAVVTERDAFGLGRLTASLLARRDP